MEKKRAIIIGAGPAGLTAAYELIHRTDIKPIIYELSQDIGGIAKTINYSGNRIDIGGHRFFSKSQKVTQWWLNIFPLQEKPSKDDLKLGREFFLSEGNDGPDPEKEDKVMLVRRRISRIFYLRKFFDYPLSLNFKTFSNLGLQRIFKIGLSYIKARIFPIKEEKNLEEFFINRFGRELYVTFFKDYTQKVWGTPCSQIGAELGAQRVKGLSVTKAIGHAIKKIIFINDSSMNQEKTETSLIEKFMYPKYGPGQFWEEVANIVKEKGGELHLRHRVVSLKYRDNQIIEAQIKDDLRNEVFSVKADYVFSTMPIKELMECFGENVPENVKNIGKGLMYRDFITVGLLLNKLKVKNETKIKTINNIIPDNWIYIQERDVRVGRVQVFNNWSPYLVKNENTVWLGVEYFCNEGDQLWSKTNSQLSEFAIKELTKIGFIEKEDVLDSVVIRMPKTYPAYCGVYKDLPVVANFTDKFENLFLLGRNGMHHYNNMDHSMMTAIVAVDNIIGGVKSKDNIWSVNVEKDYQE